MGHFIESSLVLEMTRGNRYYLKSADEILF